MSTSLSCYPARIIFFIIYKMNQLNFVERKPDVNLLDFIDENIKISPNGFCFADTGYGYFLYGKYIVKYLKCGIVVVYF
jgi:hypothetical protein